MPDFLKMHGCGNDFAVVLAESSVSLPAVSKIRDLADRRRGIGFDQLLWVTPSDQGLAAYYRVFNADGGEVGQCGNGARCVAAAVAAANGLGPRLRLGSPAGAIEAKLETDGLVSVNMGVPKVAPAAVPFAAPGKPDDSGRYVVVVNGQDIHLSVASLGNPHAVIRVDDIAAAPIAEIGSALQQNEAFPERVNVGFLQPNGRDRGQLRVYERGVGETAACGTGACAAAVAGRLAGWFDDTVTLTLPGGDLVISWAATDAPIWLKGPAETAYTGHFDL